MEPSLSTLIAHRGESADAPENTLPAYSLAVERGFGFECDLYLSRDGRLFTFHDDTLALTTGGADTRRCAEATWDELSRLDVGGWGKWKGSRFAGTRPALLEEVLELARDGRCIYIEVKAGPEAVEPIARVLAAQRRANTGNVLFISFHADVCAALKKRLPQYKVFWLSETRDAKGEAVSPRDVVATLRRIGADGVDIHFDPAVHDDDYVREVRNAGFEFHAWVVNHPMKTLLVFCRGGQSVTTDCPKAQLDAMAAEIALPW
ncbi:MAG: hypothetical protein IJK04_16900 [Kiritimatiellae bacterium]|nr:hypothetical protein [Kiritimatiellia bacterium]